jgi:hypothetical protein
MKLFSLLFVVLALLVWAPACKKGADSGAGGATAMTVKLQLDGMS